MTGCENDIIRKSKKYLLFLIVFTISILGFKDTSYAEDDISREDIISNLREGFNITEDIEFSNNRDSKDNILDPMTTYILNIGKNSYATLDKDYNLTGIDRFSIIDEKDYKYIYPSKEYDLDKIIENLRKFKYIPEDYEIYTQSTSDDMDFISLVNTNKYGVKNTCSNICLVLDPNNGQILSYANTFQDEFHLDDSIKPKYCKAAALDRVTDILKDKNLDLHIDEENMELTITNLNFISCVDDFKDKIKTIDNGDYIVSYLMPTDIGMINVNGNDLSVIIDDYDIPNIGQTLYNAKKPSFFKSLKYIFQK